MEMLVLYSKDLHLIASFSSQESLSAASWSSCATFYVEGRSLLKSNVLIFFFSDRWTWKKKVLFVCFIWGVAFLNLKTIFGPLQNLNGMFFMLNMMDMTEQ